MCFAAVIHPQQYIVLLPVGTLVCFPELQATLALSSILPILSLHHTAQMTGWHLVCETFWSQCHSDHFWFWSSQREQNSIFVHLSLFSVAVKFDQIQVCMNMSLSAFQCGVLVPHVGFNCCFRGISILTNKAWQYILRFLGFKGHITAKWCNFLNLPDCSIICLYRVILLMIIYQKFHCLNILWKNQ